MNKEGYFMVCNKTPSKDSVINFPYNFPEILPSIQQKIVLKAPLGPSEKPVLQEISSRFFSSIPFSRFKYSVTGKDCDFDWNRPDTGLRHLRVRGKSVGELRLRTSLA